MSLLLKCFNKNYPALMCRTFHASSVRNETFEKFFFHAGGFHKYGLLKDDLLSEFSPEVREAIERLPEEERLQRIYRAIRAQQAYLNHVHLPKDQWTKFEDNHNYLQPYLEELKKEKKEMAEWEANH